MSRYSTARSAFQDFFPECTAVAVWHGEEEPALMPLEEEAIRRANERRRIEFSRGRVTARRALSTLGVDRCDIGVGEHREPLWPAGYIGSITHCEGLVAAAAAPTDRITALGIDAEPEGPLPSGTRRLILTGAEATRDPTMDMAIFSAKESIHKAIFPLTGVWMDFLDVVVQFDDPSTFTARPAPGRGPLPLELTAIQGRFVHTDGFVLTGCHLPAPGR